MIVKPSGTRTGPPMRFISAMFAPLPPSSSRISREPSENSYTHFFTAPADSIGAADRLSHAAQPDVRVVLDRSRQRPAPPGRGSSGWRLGASFSGSGERAHHERARGLVEREAVARPAVVADDAARGGREPQRPRPRPAPRSGRSRRAPARSPPPASASSGTPAGSPPPAASGCESSSWSSWQSRL